MNSIPIIVIDKTYTDTVIKGLVKLFDLKEVEKTKYIHWCEVNGDFNKSPSKDFYDGEFLHLVDKKAIKDAKNNKCVIVFSTTQESFGPTVDYKVDEYADVDVLLYNQAIKYKIDPKNLIWVSGDHTVKERQKNKIIKTFGFTVYGHSLVKQVKNEIQDFRHKLKPFTQRNFQKDYISLNRFMKPGRLHMFYKLEEYGILDKGFVSAPDMLYGLNFKKRYSMWIDRLYANYNLFTDKEYNKETLQLHFTNINKRVPYVLDISDFEGNNCLQPDSTESSIHFYNNSFVNLCTETQAEGNGVYISEAGFRPFIYGQPAIWIGQANTVKKFKEFGFETWDWLIDESYDSIEKMIDRIDCAIESLQQTFKIEKTPQLLERIEEQNLYNYEVFNKKFYNYQKNSLSNILNMSIQ